jgi:serine protease Do
MTIRSVFSLLISLFLTASFALAQQTPLAPTPPPTPGAPFGQSFSFLIDGGSFLGVYAEDINKENMGRYGLREARGVGITSIVKDSPAEKAGLRKDDVILRFDGESVTSARKLTRLVSEVAPDQTVRLGISRGSSEQEVAVTICKRKYSMDTFHKLEGLGDKFEGLSGRFEGLEGHVGPGARVWKWEGPDSDNDGFVFAFGNNRRIGVSTTQLTKQLAEFFGVADGKGVLVTSVGDDSPAAKAGIKAGDVITAVDGEKIEGAGDLTRALGKKKEGDVTLTIVRDKNQRSITVTPKAANTTIVPSGTGPQGRRIIIPRINLPNIPPINIMIPGINLPTIPEINVNIEGLPRGRGKTISGPI